MNKNIMIDKAKWKAQNVQKRMGKTQKRRIKEKPHQRHNRSEKKELVSTKLLRSMRQEEFPRPRLFHLPPSASPRLEIRLHRPVGAALAQAPRTPVLPVHRKTVQGKQRRRAPPTTQIGTPPLRLTVSRGVELLGFLPRPAILRA
ncbi:uncharacterized protein Tco025E_08855 [Trypanosoma conorhini]|uniref:Uncharacterized protein n=1 Tax=Trypanosoma conorhini TaxID=83891 RepID=A0A3R7N639_9TRYP|nr:uncharacterized protein Tco025E_08855 [Trypanosoma conorhini]RNF00834.1 hypothetical protein Tco025E_08855 [Trypanosoma conorhini]